MKNLHRAKLLHYVIDAPAKQPPGSAQRSACGQRRTPRTDFPTWGARTWDATTCGACKRTQAKEEHPAALTADQCLRRIERSFAEMMR